MEPLPLDPESEQSNFIHAPTFNEDLNNVDGVIIPPNIEEPIQSFEEALKAHMVTNIII